MRPKAVTNQHAWFLVSTSFCLWIKHTLEPLKADFGVGISRFGACIVLSRGAKCSPVASVGNSWPDNHWQQRPTGCTYTLDGSYHRPLDPGASVVSRIILTN